MNWTVEKVKNALKEEGFSVTEESNIKNNTGTRLTLENGAIVNVFNTGKVNVQGKNHEQLSPLFDGEKIQSQYINKNVFVVYGHDTTSRDQLELFLKKTEFTPIILDQLASGGKTIIEKLESNIKAADFGVVLLTPDDEGHKKGDEQAKMGRARQNVVLELGMLLALLGRENVFILIKEQENIEKPSDIAGLIYMPFKENVKEIGPFFAKEVERFGINIPGSALS
ncbi:MAG: nucleotide-binding protein [Defluviitaleaceae bacterium]|nr:nucleotide-binding protein [Defluviitaleaceae bacterium]